MMIARPEVMELTGHSQSVSITKLLGDDRLVSGTVDGELIVWDLKNGRELFRATGDQWPNCNAPVAGIEFASDMQHVISWQNGPSTGFRIWTITDGRLVQHAWVEYDVECVWVIDADHVLAYSFSAFDEPHIYRLGVFSIRDGTCLWSTERQHTETWDLKFRLVGQRTFMTRVGSEAILWDIDEPRPLRELNQDISQSCGPEATYRVSHSGRVLAVHPEGLTLWDGSTGDLIGNLRRRKIRDADFFEDDVLFFTDRSVFTWSGRGNPSTTLTAQKGRIQRFSDILVLLDGFVWCRTEDKSQGKVRGSAVYVNGLTFPKDKTVNLDNEFVRLMVASDIVEGADLHSHVVALITSYLGVYSPYGIQLWQAHFAGGQLDTLSRALVVDERRVLTAHDDGQVLLWEKAAKRPTVLVKSTGQPAEFWALLSSAVVVTGDESGTCAFFNLDSEEKLLIGYQLEGDLSGLKCFIEGGSVVTIAGSKILLWTPRAAKTPDVLFEGAAELNGVLLEKGILAFTSACSPDLVVVRIKQGQDPAHALILRPSPNIDDRTNQK